MGGHLTHGLVTPSWTSGTSCKALGMMSTTRFVNGLRREVSEQLLKQSSRLLMLAIALTVATHSPSYQECPFNNHAMNHAFDVKVRRGRTPHLTIGAAPVLGRLSLVGSPLCLPMIVEPVAIGTRLSRTATQTAAAARPVCRCRLSPGMSHIGRITDRFRAEISV